MRLTWDGIGTRYFKAGLDRGVLYPMYDSEYGTGVAWSGLTAIDDSTAGHEKTALYVNDYKRKLLFSPFEFGGTIKCYTYPDAFDDCIGNEEVLRGMFAKGYDQIPFGLSYRTAIGNDIEGVNAGYEIHLLYALHVTESKEDAETLGSDVNAVEFSFPFESTFEDFTDNDPVSHIVLNSLTINKDKLSIVEEILYGTDDEYPRLPLPDELYSIIFDPEDVPDEWKRYPYDYRYPSDDVYPEVVT